VLALSADGRYLAVGASDERFDFSAGERISTQGAIHVFDVERGTLAGPVHVGHKGAISRLALSPDGTRLASASTDGTVRLWGRDSVRAETIITGASGHGARAVAFAGGAVAVAFEGEPARLVDPAGQTIATSRANPVSTLDVVEAHRVVLGTERGVVLWDPTMMSEVTLPTALRARAVESLRASAQGTVVADLGDGTLEIIDLANGRARTASLLPNAEPVAVATGASWMLTGTANGKVSVWDLASGRAVADLESGSEGTFNPVARRAAAAASGDRLAAILDGVPTVIDLSPDALVRRSCEIAGQGLTPDEWRALAIDLPYDDLCATH
jgi:WD40 repeat protein